MLSNRRLFKLNDVIVFFLQWLQQRVRIVGWDQELTITEEIISEINWWLENLEDWNGKAIIPQDPTIELFTDASETGWGATCLGTRAQGHWSIKQMKQSSNFRELTAIFLGLKSFEKQLEGKVILGLGLGLFGFRTLKMYKNIYKPTATVGYPYPIRLGSE